MTSKHIHIHLPTRRVVSKARDAGWDESKHKRNHGQFATTSGPNGGDHEHHFRQGEHHEAEAAKLANHPSAQMQAASKAHAEAGRYHHEASERLKTGRHEDHADAQAFANKANQAALRALDLRGGKGAAPLPAHLAQKPAANSSGVEVKHQPSGTTVPHQAPQTASKAGAGTQTHHSMIRPGDSLHDKNGQKIDHVESIGRAMHAGERTITTRAGYEHHTKGGHLPDGMHAKTSSYTEK